MGKFDGIDDNAEEALGKFDRPDRCAHCDGLLSRGSHMQCREALRHEAFLADYPHQCPKCSGRKEVPNGMRKVKVDRLMTDEERGFADIRHMYPIRVTEEVERMSFIKCDLCDGVGRLQNEPKAITGVVRWERQ